VKKMKFRKDDGTVVKVPWDVAMDRLDCGFLTLDDGEVVRRIVEPQKAPQRPRECAPAPIISDAAGFVKKQLGQMEEHRKANGFTGVEFREDPKVPGFMQTVFNCSESERKRYFEHRQLGDGEVSSCTTAPTVDLEAAREMTYRKGFGDAFKKKMPWER
jgi:hypothetical protein